MKDYKVVFLADSHVYDWEGMFGMTSEERLRFAVEGIFREHREYGKIDMVFMPGDFCNNLLLEEYPAGEFMGESYGAGSSGSDNDPMGLLRLSRFNRIVQPLWDNGISVFCANGNHDICSHLNFERAFGYSKLPSYITGARRSAEYPKGYGKNYAVALNDETAFVVFDVFDGENGGFVSNSSGRNWAETTVASETVQMLFDSVKDYPTVFVVSHWLNRELQAELLDEIAKRDNVKVSFVGHSHSEKKQPLPCGKPEYVCGYLGVPMYERQKNFQNEPFSYRVLESKNGVLTTHIVLFEKDYPSYTFTRSSGASIEAFYQPYLIRGKDMISG